jgi:hypothetical protein
MSFHEQLTPQARQELKDVGRAKGLELARVARRTGRNLSCATWLHKAPSLPKDQFEARGGEGADGAGDGNAGDYLLQAVKDPDSGGRASD